MSPTAGDGKSLTEYRYNSAWDTRCRDEVGYIEYSFGVSESDEPEPGAWDWSYSMSATLNPMPTISAEQSRRILILQSKMGGKMLMQNHYANDFNHPVEKQSYVYDFYENSEIPHFEAEFMWLGYWVKYRYSFDPPYLCRTIKELYDEQGVKLSETANDIELDDMARTARTVTKDSKGGTVEQKYYYHPEVPAFLTNHLVLRNDKIIDATRYNFCSILSSQQDAFYVPFSREKGKVTPLTIEAGISYFTDVTYDLYDSFGHPLQITDKTGKSTCFIWGYDGMYPIAKIENTTYDVLSDQYGISGLHSGALPSDIETTLREIEGNIQVTTYTYKPLVGLTSVKDPSGHTETYEYDNHGKLLRIKDHKGINIKSFEYNIVSENNQ